MEHGCGRHPSPVCNGATELAVYHELGGAGLLSVFTEVLHIGVLE